MTRARNGATEAEATQVEATPEAARGEATRRGRRELAGLQAEPALWQPPAGAFRTGQWLDSPTTIDVLDPEDGALVGIVADVSPHEVTAAVADLADELRHTHWPLWRRRETLARAADLLRERGSVLARLISRESSKTIREARAEVARAAETLALTARSSGHLSGEEVAFADSDRGAGRFGWFTREPVGVIAVISSFNDPLNLLVHKIGPALLGGNTVAVKPSELTPLTALFLTETLLDAGVPAHRVSTLPGRSGTGRALVEEPAVRLVGFTGGPRTGEQIARQAGAKLMLMELGGNCPVIVCADADIDAAATAVREGSFGVAGQNCISVQRVLVAAAVRDRLLDTLVKQVRELTVGTKSAETTDIGPLITEAEAQRVEAWVDRAVEAGATLHTGGRRDGGFYTPTVLGDVPHHTDVWNREIFGPVVCVNSYEDEADAVRAANDTDYGLQAGVFTRDIDRAFDLAGQLAVGAVMINDSSDFRLDSMPFGGPKGSSLGREGVRDTLLAMTQPKVVAIRSQTPRSAQGS
ncbi:aldehyde dehydrogenase family protein [Streptomyces sp. NPDC051572]|uniref:aldehyde dehydrogenase family protein n=1 Tax=unclassified Streptomyces TaxID=2593676 RepID=UPI0034510375